MRVWFWQDGVTVAKHIEFKDPLENMGAQLVRQVASKTNDAAGDGTTTATVLTRAMYTEGCKSVAAGMNPMELRKGMQLVRVCVCVWLDGCMGGWKWPHQLLLQVFALCLWGFCPHVLLHRLLLCALTYVASGAAPRLLAICVRRVCVCVST